MKTLSPEKLLLKKEIRNMVKINIAGGIGPDLREGCIMSGRIMSTLAGGFQGATGLGVCLRRECREGEPPGKPYVWAISTQAGSAGGVRPSRKPHPPGYCSVQPINVTGSPCRFELHPSGHSFKTSCSTTAPDCRAILNRVKF